MFPYDQHPGYRFDVLEWLLPGAVISRLGNQRCHGRLIIYQPVKVLSRGRLVASVVAMNLSFGGVLLSPIPQLAVGSRYELAPLLPGAQGRSAKVLEGQVIRSDAQGTAVRFVANGSSYLRAYAFNRVQEGVKRTLDLALVLLGLPFALPLLLLIALVLRLDSAGPILFSQEQLGRGGKRIRPLKFRTMEQGAEETLCHILAQDGPMAEEYRRFHKLKHDPRVTRVGRFLRKTSLDELPQIFNVLKGEMSLVGPRPYLPRELSMMAGKEEVILLSRPGITGFWQVFGRNETTFRKRLQMDTYYVRNWSLGLDAFLFLRTFYVVLAAKGAC